MNWHKKYHETNYEEIQRRKQEREDEETNEEYKKESLFERLQKTPIKKQEVKEKTINNPKKTYSKYKKNYHSDWEEIRKTCQFSDSEEE